MFTKSWFNRCGCTVRVQRQRVCVNAHAVLAVVVVNRKNLHGCAESKMSCTKLLHYK
jgi:hypothetical protein